MWTAQRARRSVAQTVSWRVRQACCAEWQHQGGAALLPPLPVRYEPAHEEALEHQHHGIPLALRKKGPPMRRQL